MVPELTDLKRIFNFVFICSHITWKTNITNKTWLYQIKLGSQTEQNDIFSVSSGLVETR